MDNFPTRLFNLAKAELHFVDLYDFDRTEVVQSSRLSVSTTKVSSSYFDVCQSCCSDQYVCQTNITLSSGLTASAILDVKPHLLIRIEHSALHGTSEQRI
jgi:hypothetical protein